MSHLERIFSFYINSSTHVALAVLSLTIITAFEFSLVLPIEIYGLIFFGTIIGYNFIKYIGVSKKQNRPFTRSLNLIHVITVLSLCAFIYCSFYLTINMLVVMSLFGVITLLYVIPFYNNRNLRNWARIKIFMVALVWAGMTVIFPLISQVEVFDQDQILSFVQRFIWVFVLTLPFDIRDLSLDHEGLRTIPQLLGLKKTKILGGALLLFCFLMEFLKTQYLLSQILSMLFACLLALIALYFSQKKQLPYYASFWVESIPLIWLGALVLISKFVL